MSNVMWGTSATGLAIPTGITTSKLPSWEKTIFQQDPDETPFYSVMSMLEGSDAADPRLYWTESADVPMTDTVAADALTPNLAAVGTGAGWIPVTNISYWYPDMEVINQRTGEAAVVTERNEVAPTSVKLGIRGMGTSGVGVLIAVGDTWTLIQNGREELSNAPECLTHAPSIYYNYCQFMSDTMEMSHIELGRKKIANLTDENVWDFQIQQKIREFKKRVEATFFKGVRYESVTGSPATNVRRFTGGLDYWLQNSPTGGDMLGGVLNYSDVIDILGAYQAENNITQCDIFGRPQLMVEFQKMFAGDIVYQNKLPNGLDFNYTEIQLTNCKYRLHGVPTLHKIDSHDLYLIDMSGNRKKDRPIKVKYMQVGGGTEKTKGRPTVIDNQQNPSYSADKSQVVAGMGFVLQGHSFGRFAKISNVAHM
jgi:hypothetical protein